MKAMLPAGFDKPKPTPIQEALGKLGAAIVDAQGAYLDAGNTESYKKLQLFSAAIDRMKQEATDAK